MLKLCLSSLSRSVFSRKTPSTTMRDYLRVTAVVCLIILYAITTVFGLCEPDCAGKIQGDKVIDPYDCSSFYFCKDNEIPFDDSFPCEDGEIFDEEVGECVNGTTCDNSCDIEPTSSLNCLLTSCDDAVGLVTFPDLEDCSKYYLCDLQNNPVSSSCGGDDGVYDGSQCVSDESQCCLRSLCTPFCSVDDYGTLVADPCDCYSYYLCSESDKIPTYSSSCDQDQYFNATQKKCVDSGTEPCTQTCPESNCLLFSNLDL